MNVSPSKFWRYFAWWNITKYMTILELVFASQNKHTPTKNRVLRSGGSTMSLCQNYCCLQKNDWCQNIWIYCSWSSMCMSQCCRHSIVSEAEPFGANFGLRFCAFKNSLVDEVCFSRFFSRLFSLFFLLKMDCQGCATLCMEIQPDGSPRHWSTNPICLLVSTWPEGDDFCFLVFPSSHYQNQLFPDITTILSVCVGNAQLEKCVASE